MSIILSKVREIISVMKTKTLVFSEKLYQKSSFYQFNSSFVETFILDMFQITEKKQQTKNQQLSDKHLT